eukprot:maker-scaffold56_size446035-snap-gene-3.33 protein:Tk11511 transcript:maker-scaffold56_size446035-snap-gene-3.33-mRNA-1 annotation:"hypothetical protein L798_14914"
MLRTQHRIGLQGAPSPWSVGHQPHRPRQSRMGTICGKEQVVLAQSQDQKTAQPVTNGVHPPQSDPSTSTSRQEAPRREILFSGISLSARNALRQMETFGEEFVREKFSANFNAYHIEWIDQRYEWFLAYEEIPKNLNEVLPTSFLDSKSPQECLPTMRYFLEKILIVLNQIAKDLREAEDRFAELFGTSKDMVNGVLNEVAITMRELNITPKTPTRKDFIPQVVVEIGHTSFRNHRDWFLYRDSRNILEYIIAVSEYFRQNNVS